MRPARRRNVTVGRGDFLLIRTGQMAKQKKLGHWDGLSGRRRAWPRLRDALLLHEKQVAAVATDTWGVEVRPNDSEANQPWHWICIPIMA